MMKNINSILVISLSNIGDVILTLPVAGGLRGEFPEANISILIGRRAYPAVKDNPEFSRVIVYDKHKTLGEKFLFIKKLRRERYDLVVDLRHSLFPLFLRSRYHSPIFAKRSKFPEHQVRKHLRSLGKFGIKPDKIRFPFYISEGAKENIKRRFGGRINSELIVINPTAASHLKCWADDGFILLAQRIQDVYNLPIAFISGREDREKCAKISGEIKGSFNLGGKLNFQELAALLQKAKIFITNDSGPLHLASALGVPTLAIFGPTDPVKYGPLSPIKRVVRKNLSCSPCELAQCPREHQCLKSLSVDEVFLKFEEIMNEAKQKKS